MGNAKKKKNHVPKRLNILFFTVFILFFIVILRLGMVQIVNGEEYLKDLESTTNMTARIDAPRGLMYDRYGTIVVDNELELSITYTSPSVQVSEEEKLEVAKRLEKLIEVDTSSITERDMKDYWILTRSEEALAKVSNEERREIDDNHEEYLLTLERITKEDLSEITEKELRVLAIKREMDRGYALAPQRIKQGISIEEAHVVGENLADLPGIDILRDATRKYPYDDVFKSLIGRTGSIPKEKLDYFLSRGYERSDIVGTSYLELQYEDALRGQKAVIENLTSGGQVIGEAEERIGSRGNDLVLSLDIELQKRVQEVIRKEVDSSKGAFLGDSTAYVVMLHPKTGEVYSLVGYEDDTGTVNSAFEMGSAVKGATVLTGFQTGVVKPGEVINDSPIKLPATPDFKSVRNWGPVNDQKALEVSSNVYMGFIAMRMAGYNYSSQCCWNNISDAFNDMRYYFSQFGLGVETGIDLPSEAIGYIGGIGDYGNILHLSIGQYDTYTPIQLAQYTSTIANGGYRIKPQLVKEIREPSSDKEELGKVIHQFEPTVLNRIDMPDEYITRVQNGFRRVVTGGNGTARNFADLPYDVAAKTGTAEVEVYVQRGQGTQKIKGNNQTLTGWAPYKDPEVAFAVVVPEVRKNSAPISRNITQGVLDAYFDLKEERQSSKKKDDDDEENDE